LAKVADNVATVSVVAALLGGFVDKKVTIVGVLVLIFLAIIFLIVSYILRKGENDGD
jgi:MFS-type transporter involved in bile tolerance (Atg22 family)